MNICIKFEAPKVNDYNVKDYPQIMSNPRSEKKEYHHSSSAISASDSENNNDLTEYVRNLKVDLYQMIYGGNHDRGNVAISTSKLINFSCFCVSF